MSGRNLRAVVVGATVLLSGAFIAPLSLAVGAAAASTRTSSPIGACTTLDPALEAAAPGTSTFDTRAHAALTDGCADYVEDATSTLYLEFLRGAATGRAISIGPITTAGGEVELTDVALSPAGVLYGVDFGSDLYTIDPDTAQATLIGPVGAVVNGLVVGPTGTLFASGSLDLYSLNPSTGAGTVIGSWGSGFSSAGDLAFSNNGTLFMTGDPLTGTGTVNDVLVKVDPSDGAGTVIGSIGEGTVYGLAYDFGTLFAQSADGDLISVNPTTGAATVLGTGGPAANGIAVPPAAASSNARSVSTTAPRVVITSSAIALTKGTRFVPVTMRCAVAACAGLVELTGSGSTQKKIGTRTVTQATTVVLAEGSYRLARGGSGHFSLALTKLGRALARQHSTSPLQETLVASVKGGVYATRGVVANGGVLSGTYALSVTPGSCGPTGNGAGQVMYVQGSAVTDPAGDVAGPFTGTFNPEGLDDYLVLVQPANEIMDAITIVVTDGGDDISGSGQLNLDAGNNVPCTISFTGHRTSTSVPRSISSPTTTTTTTAPPATTTTTTAPPASASAAPCTAEAITPVVQAAITNFYKVDTYGCAGDFAYAGVTVTGQDGQPIAEVTALLMAVNGAWQTASAAVYCQNGSVPAAIFQLACESN